MPSESVFSRVFAEWSGREWVAQLQADVIAEVYRDRLVGHVIRDATALPARERCRRKTTPPVQPPPSGPAPQRVAARSEKTPGSTARNAAGRDARRCS